MLLRRLGLACLCCLVLAASCNLPQPPIPTGLGSAQLPAGVAFGSLEGARD